MRVRWACSGGHGAVPAWAGCLMILGLYPASSQAEPTTGRANTPDLIASCAHFTRAVARFGSHTDAQPVPHHRATTIAARHLSLSWWVSPTPFILSLSWATTLADFSSEQGTQLRADLQIVHDWHRSMEIPRLVQQLRDLQAMAPKDVTPDQVCRVVDAVQERVQVTLERMVPAVARVAPTVQSAQLSHFSKALEARERKWQEEWLQPPLPERNQHRAKQWLQRLESFYGDLDKAQVALIHAHIPQSSVNPELQLREIQRRHQDILQTFKRVHDKAMQKEDTRGELQALLARSLHSPDATYRRYAAQVRQESCQLMSELHKLSSPAQRQHLINTLKSYEIDS